MLVAVLILQFIMILIISFWTYCKLSVGRCKYSGHLVGKVAIVTGANAGIGFETAKDLAQRGACVILACRNSEKSANAMEKIIASSGNKEIHSLMLDLSSFASIKRFVEDVSKLTQRLDILINNAGVLKADNEHTEDGLSKEMQINYFGPFLLTTLLLPLLKKSAPSRIINVSSFTYKLGFIDLENLTRYTNRGLFGYREYCNSKLCMILMTTELERRLKGTNVTANSLHPGGVNTKIFDQVSVYLVRLVLKILQTFFKTAWEGAQTTIYLAVSPDVQHISGKYFVDCQISTLNSKAEDLIVSQKLFDESKKLLKLL